MTKVFTGLKSPEKVATHARASMLLDMDLEAACAKLRASIEKAPSSYNTRLKNFVHALAVGTKS